MQRINTIAIIYNSTIHGHVNARPMHDGLNAPIVNTPQRVFYQCYA